MAYKSKSTALNGVIVFLINYNIETEQKNTVTNTDVHKVIKSFFDSIGIDPGKNINRDAEIVQNNFKAFKNFINSKYKRNKRAGR